MKIPNHPYTGREITVVSLVNSFNDTNKISSWLNIGFRNWTDPRSHWWVKLCEENNIDWKITEIFKPNVDDSIAAGCPPDQICQGDIMNTDSYDSADLLIFWHGPEHIIKEDFLAKLPEIEKKAKKLIIFGMPDGFLPQGECYGNEWEEHVSGWTKEDWHTLGYKTLLVEGSGPGNHITAYKEV
tara:strand:- start:2646 stop:3197 length:552 start_codon:yes stop_codon:yes gene_type:complete